jgi:PAS domain S-box-containing protein
MSKVQRIVLIVDDNPEDQEAFRRYLMRNTDIDYKCHAVQTAAETLRQFRALRPDAILLDYRLPDDDGLSLLVKLLAKPEPPAIIMLTAFGNEALAVRAMKLGAQDYLVKDAQIEQHLALTIECAIEKANLQRQVKQQRRELEASNLRLEQVLAAQQASLTQLNLAIQASHMATWEWDLVTNQIRWGAGLEEMIKMEPGTFRGTFDAFFELVHPRDRQLVLQTLDRTIHEGTAYEVEFRMVRTDGSILYVASYSHVVRDERGKPIRMLGIGMDITERKQAEAALRSSEKRLHTVWEMASDAIALSDAEGIVLNANPAYCALYGYQPNEVIGQSFAMIFPPSQRAWAVEQYREIIRTRTMLPTYESSIQRADGEVRFVESRATLIEIGDGEMGMLSIIRDITDRARAEDRRARMLEQEQLARETAEAAAEYSTRLQHVTAALGKALNLQQVAEIILNEGLAALGAQAGTIVVPIDDSSTLEVFHAIGYPPSVVQRWQRFPLSATTPLSDAVRTGQPVLLESRSAAIERYPQIAMMERVFGDGAILAFPLKIGEKVLGGLGVSFAELYALTAITLEFMTSLVQQCAQAFERAQFYQAIEQARADAQEAVRERDAFLSIASHEIKNPLTSLLGRAQLLQRRLGRISESGEMRGDIRIIIDQSQRINTLVTNLLDMSRVTGEAFASAHIPVDLGVLVSHVAASIQLSTSAHRIEVRSRVSPLMIVGDGSRLEQVFHNLISNAVKYSPAGGAITIDLSAEGAYARADITDSGLGIPAAALAHLFKRFYRVERDTTQQIQGSGIGLYVAKEIITSHGGTIRVVSAENAGTTFTLLLPLNQ